MSPGGLQNLPVVLALVFGAVALMVKKGGTIHRRSGLLLVARQRGAAGMPASRAERTRELQIGRQVARHAPRDACNHLQAEQRAEALVLT